ncbi:Ras GTPase activating protein ira2, partial [Nowakowskiella sp. JEL0078]
MALVLILSPETLFKIGSSGNPGSNQFQVTQNSNIAHKRLFLDTISQFLRHSGVSSGIGVNLENRSIPGVGVLGEGMAMKLSEVAVFCYVDLCRAATFVSKSDGFALRSTVSNIESDLREKLFDIQRQNLDNRSQSTKDVGVMGSPIQLLNISQNLTQKEREDFKYSEDLKLDRAIMTDAISSFFKLNSWNTIRYLIPQLLARDAPYSFKLAYVRAFHRILSERFPLSWNPTVDS